MTNAFSIAVVLIVFLGTSIHAFVPPPASTNSAHRSSSFLNYFDDVSRHSMEWHPKHHHEDDSHAQKMAALKKHVLGHDAISASYLSNKQVKQATRAWAKRFHVVENGRTIMEGAPPPLYEKLTGMTVCRNSDMLGCLAYYWRRIVKVSLRDEEERDNANFLHAMVFPYCKALYSYEKFQLLQQAVDLGQPSECSLTMFHPKYKNAPTMFSPQRHAPFPTAGLVPKKKNDNAYLDDNSVHLDRQRVNLERLYNSAAASATSNDESSNDDDTESTKETLYRPAHEVVQLTRDWFDETTTTTTTLETTTDDRWFVSDATLAEEAYADVYTVIHDLYLLGLDTMTPRDAVVVVPRYCTYNAPQWRHFCITVNAVLKKFGYYKMHVEYYHGEHDEDAARQSPFPTIQIVHQG